MLRRAVIAAVLVLGLAAPGMAHAQRQDPPETVGKAASERQQAARRGVEEGRLVPLPQVISSINRRTPGRNLDANITREGDKQVYRVPWVTTDGRRIDYVVDAVTGVVISAKGG